MTDRDPQERISAYLDGELAPEERREVEALLESDPAARQLLDELRRVQQRVSQLPPRELGDDFAAGVLARAQRERAEGSRPSVAPVDRSPSHDRWRNVARGAVWSALAVAAALLVMFVGREPPPGPREVARTEISPSAPDADVVSGEEAAAPRDRELEELADEASPAPAFRAMTKGGAAGRAIADAPAGGGGMGGRQPAGAVPTDEDLLIVRLQVAPDLDDEDLVADILARQEIELTELPDPTDSTDLARVADQPEAEPTTEESLAQVEVVYVEAEPAQLEAVLTELREQESRIRSVAVQPAPSAVYQQPWPGRFDRGDSLARGAGDMGKSLRAEYMTRNSMANRVPEVAAPAPSVGVIQQQLQVLQSQLPAEAEQLAEPAARRPMSQAQRFLVRSPAEAQHETVLAEQIATPEGDSARVKLSVQDARRQASPVAGRARALFIFQVDEPASDSGAGPRK